MTSPAQSRGLRKATRDLLQAALAVIAAGGATALIDLVVGSVDPSVGIVLAFAFKIIITGLQNGLESAGRIKVLLPTPGIVSTAAGADSALAPAVGAVEAVADVAGEVTGTVTDMAGGIVGTVTGQLEERGDSQ